MLRESLRRPVFAFLAGTLVAFPLWGQAVGSVSGVVTDPGGSLIPKAHVRLISLDTGETRDVDAADDGIYVFSLVAPGVYRVQVTAQGFKADLIDHVIVQVNSTTREDAQLSVGATSEEITVAGTSPLVETGNATLGTVIDHEEGVDLPLNGRNFAQLGTLIPGVVAAPASLGGLNGNATPGGFGNSTGSFNVNGMRNQSNNFLLDGVPNNDPFNSGFVMRPPPDFIDQFKIITHSYEAQYGRNAGSVVNVVTREGTNTFRGSIWEFNREAALAAKNYFSAGAKPDYLQNQFGGTIGGRILRDRLFFSAYYEGYRVKDATSNTLSAVVPTAAERMGDFSSVSTPVIDPLTGMQATYGGRLNVFDPARVSAVSQYIYSHYIPLPDPACSATLTLYCQAQPNIDNRNTAGIRLDGRLGDHSLMGRFLYSYQNLFGPISPSNFAPAGNRQVMKMFDAMGSDTWTIHSNLLNVVRYGRQWIDGHPNTTSGLNLQTVGYDFTSTSSEAVGLPYVLVTSNFSTGDAQQPFAYRANSVDTISDDLTWTKGKHTFQFGGEFRRDWISLLYINRPNGAFTFTNFFTGNYQADFFLGVPYEFQQGSGDPSLIGSSYTYSAYGQDQFRLNTHLTIEAGVRYEVNLPYAEADNHLAAFHPGQQSTIEPAAPAGLVYPGDANTPRSTYYADTNNVAPRLGIVYDPTGNAKTVIRAAWGIFFDSVPGQGDFFQSGTLAPPFQPLQEVDFYTRAKSAASSAYFSSPYTGIAVTPDGFPPNLTFIGWTLPHSFQTPSVQQYNLSVEQQLARQVAFELGYVGSRGKYLPIFIEANPTLATLAGSAASTAYSNAYTAGARLMGSAFGLVRPTFSAASSWYDSLQANLNVRAWHGLRLTAAYTWSRSIDDVSGLNIGTDSRPVLPVTIGDSSSIRAAMVRERGNSLFDTRNRFVLSLGYKLPQLNGSRRAERLALGGWQLNSIFQAQSGNPFTAVNASTTAQSLTFRPNLTCNPNHYKGRKAGASDFYINVSCFSLPTVATGNSTLIDNSHSGNEPRGVIVGPGFEDTDASLFKVFHVREKQAAEFRFEVFNVLNQPHFAQPNLTFAAASGSNIASSAASATFGRITSTVGNDSRVVQIAFKYSF